MTRDEIYDAIKFHDWRNGACSCGWTKPLHSVGFYHHLADLVLEAEASKE